MRLGPCLGRGSAGLGRAIGIDEELCECGENVESHLEGRV